MDLFEKIMELSQMGYHCSQIIMILTLESIQEENEGLIRALGGLGGGIGYSGNTCGCLTGAACAISYFLGKKSPEEKEDPDNQKAIREVYDWFTDEIAGNFGGVACKDICSMDWSIILQKCPEIIAGTYEKTMEILMERGSIEE